MHTLHSLASFNCLFSSSNDNCFLAVILLIFGNFSVFGLGLDSAVALIGGSFPLAVLAAEQEDTAGSGVVSPLSELSDWCELWLKKTIL